VAARTVELRDYLIREGHLDDFIHAWRSGVVPLRGRHGFTIDAAWVARAELRFVWLLSLDADQAEFARRNEAYYLDPRRTALDPDPAQWIERSTEIFVENLTLESGPPAS
jgi:hypothetical protein